MLLCLVAICTTFICGISGQKSSPCPGTFTYEQNNHENRWNGLINLQTDEILNGISLTIAFDRQAETLGNWFGKTSTNNNREFTIRKSDYVLTPGIKLTIKFYVEYSDIEAPSVTTIILNGKTICHPQQKVTSHSNSTPYTSIRLTTVRPPNRKSDTATTKEPLNISISDENCGRPTPSSATPLILHGETSTEGEWPWHTAIYETNKGTLKYTCGGTLISNSYIVTAGHCVANPKTGDIEKPTKFIVYIGTSNINVFSTNVQIGQVSQIRLHPEYTRENFHNDIAVLRMSRPFHYTDYVKPICLWEGDDELQNVVGTLGTVVGWGFDENAGITDQLMKIQMPIVDSVSCIYSKPDFFSKYTSVTSFCAGSRDGSGACNGDSGSGMVIAKLKDDGKLTWYIRGMVSVSVPNADKTQCDPFNYIVFTDVAKFIPWITRIIYLN